MPKICIVLVLWLRPNQAGQDKRQQATNLTVPSLENKLCNGRTGACPKLSCDQVSDIPLQIEKAFQKQHLFQNAKVRGTADGCLLTRGTHLFVKVARRCRQKTSGGTRMLD